MNSVRNLIVVLFAVLIASAAFAINLNVQRQDQKLATQQMLERQDITDPILADDDRLLNDQTTSSGATTSVSSFLAQPDVPRNITLTTGATTADCNAGNVVVTGTNYFGAAITESLAITENQNGVTAGAKAFKTVTNILFNQQDGDGCKFDIGVGDVLGLKRCMDSAGDVAWAVFNNVYEATRPTCIADADEVEKNTCDINGTLDGSKDIKLYFVQNFRCLP